MPCLELTWTLISRRTTSNGFPASSLKKSRKLLTVDSRMDPDTRMVLASSRCSAPREVSSSISALARQPFSGVRTCTGSSPLDCFVFRLHIPGAMQSTEWRD